MRLGTMVGGKAGAELKAHTQNVERAIKRQKKQDAAKKKRQAELEAMGFKPLKGAS